MKSARVGEDHPVAKLVHVEWRVREINELIDRQGKLIEELQESRSDLTSAKIVLDSLFVTLTLHLQERDQLRAMFNAEMAEVFAACRNASAEADQVGAGKQRNAHTIAVASSVTSWRLNLVLFGGTPRPLNHPKWNGWFFPQHLAAWQSLREALPQW